MDTAPRPDLSNRLETNIIDLGSVDLGLPVLANEEDPSIEGQNERPKKVRFNGVLLSMDISKSSAFMNDTLRSRVVVHISTDVVVASLVITIEKEKGLQEYSVNTNVKNHKRELKGLGRTLWGLSLKFMQKFADESRLPVEHLVVRDPKDGLTESKWNELFYPLLREHGYVQQDSIDPYIWEKIYQPSTK